MEKFFYRVERGDTLFSIAERFLTPAVSIITLNNLKKEPCDGDLLYIERDNCSLYRVQPFDTLESVSKKFCVSEQSLREKNGVEYLFYGLIIKL